jgi:hypothetical protein
MKLNRHGVSASGLSIKMILFHRYGIQVLDTDYRVESYGITWNHAELEYSTVLLRCSIEHGGLPDARGHARGMPEAVTLSTPTK